jgi:hypothetical protein
MHEDKIIRSPTNASSQSSNVFFSKIFEFIVRKKELQEEGEEEQEKVWRKILRKVKLVDKQVIAKLMAQKNW